MLLTFGLLLNIIIEFNWNNESNLIKDHIAINWYL
jgi:hypothetical protein